MNVDHHALGVQVTDFQMDGFPDPQSQGVGRPDERFHSPGSAGVDELKDLGLGDDFGERFDVIQFGLLEHIPFPRAGGAKEELDPTEQHRLSARGDFPLDDVVQQKLREVPASRFDQAISGGSPPVFGRPVRNRKRSAWLCLPVAGLRSVCDTIFL